MANNSNEMKTSLFGGFKKRDVLDYIGKLQEETAGINNQLDDKRKEALELRAKINELESRVNQLSEIARQAEEKDIEIEKLNSELHEAKRETLEYKDQVLQYQSRNENLANAERQIGAAYIEARRYSDEIIDNAKSRAKDVGAIASQDVKHQANEIEQLLRDVDAVSKKFNTSLEQLHKDVYALSTKLNNSASTLLNIHTELPALETPSIYEDDNIYAESSEIQQENQDNNITEETEYSEETVSEIVSKYLPEKDNEPEFQDETEKEETGDITVIENEIHEVPADIPEDTVDENKEIVSEKPDIPEDIAKEMPDAIGVEETNDGSGLTFISYEPNSEFNEDLNIQPEQIIDAEENNE
ncbi:MAG: hypothetical protein K5761_03770 [Clostridiales bacterium]|nr:hypothetical protein [Clostridiales bacterium]